MYVCGITIYDYCHVGHARALITYDVLYRHLLASGFDVTFVRNITDVDDKIIKRAIENGESIDVLTERFIQAMNEDCESLHVLAPTLQPRATELIDNMQAMINTLIEKGYAYQGEPNGDVFYAVEKFDEYGKLSGRKLEDQRAGERVAVDESKRHPMDFVLWKAAKVDEPHWKSPWGAGRPGWHIECSAMAKHTLGEHFDIHGGGNDLTFPHHENEIAQSEAANGCTMANYWLHNGMITMDGEKMSKSLGNFDTIRDVLARFNGEEIRMFALLSHYRSPLSYGETGLQGGRSALTRLYTALRGLQVGDADKADAQWQQRFDAAMNDDLNTPIALAALFELATEINKRKAESVDEASDLGALLRVLAGRLGLLSEDAEQYLQRGGDDQMSAEQVEALIAERVEARGSKDFARADAVREQLSQAGIVLEDKDGKTIWRRQK
eukprot:snap_masked-scaffold5967_size4201-processed-gene-0.0 protein:Tk01676 transcript:snap_masked-scaffold5967_size4201-processed-gene-0.0-mRNA-1 annotation:"multispecies: cysteinyl-trna synthetase"